MKKKSKKARRLERKAKEESRRGDAGFFNAAIAMEQAKKIEEERNK